jgi:predicted transcriptional regulator
MPKQMIRLEGRPLLDIASYARRGPGRRDHLSQADIELIERTVTRTPEVIVKVLSRGGQNLKAVQNHLAYLSRKGALDLETDDGQAVSGRGAEAVLLKDWDLDIETDRRQANLSATNNRQPPKLVHKLLFSMPPGTSPDNVLQAVRNFAREEFALKHRYAMVLHTDEPHPHVHMVVKAVSEQGVRLNIKKATLREWRSEFARHLRDLGVPANATERAVRGETRTHKLDGIYRATLRGDSTHMRERVEQVVREHSNGTMTVEAGKEKLLATRRDVERGWQTVRGLLGEPGDSRLAVLMDHYLRTMPSTKTERENIVSKTQDKFDVRVKTRNSASR